MSGFRQTLGDIVATGILEIRHTIGGRFSSRPRGILDLRFHDPFLSQMVRKMKHTERAIRFTVAALGVAGVLFSGPGMATAIEIQSPVISSITGGWYVSGTTLIAEKLNPNANNIGATLTNRLGGNANAPGGNVELGKFGTSEVKLTGNFGTTGTDIELSNPLLTDWRAQGDALKRLHH